MTRIAATSIDTAALAAETEKQAKAKNAYPMLKKGMSGARVKRLELLLEARGLLKGKADRFYDAKTAAAVKKVESKIGVKVNGTAGRFVQNELGMKPVADADGSRTSGTGGKTRLTTLNINIKHTMSGEKIRHDVARAVAKKPDIIGWNEVESASYRKAIHGLSKKGYETFFPKGAGGAVPISWKKKEWSLVDSGAVKTYPGLKEVSPSRYVSWVKLENKETGKTVVRMNTHLVSGAFSGKGHHAYRMDSWKTHQEKLLKLVKHFEAKGENVIVAGDFNKNASKVLKNAVKYDTSIHGKTHGRSTYDYLMSTGTQLMKTVKSWIQGGYASDHDAVAATYEI